MAQLIYDTIWPVYGTAQLVRGTVCGQYRVHHSYCGVFNVATCSYTIPNPHCLMGLIGGIVQGSLWQGHFLIMLPIITGASAKWIERCPCYQCLMRPLLHARLAPFLMTLLHALLPCTTPTFLCVEHGTSSQHG